ncbi:MAG: hypothetical protein SCM96_13005 [Acidobacteriota bacterium]|nr:hypothetical protein [Acidobacteriota bacterium]
MSDSLCPKCLEKYLSAGGSSRPAFGTLPHSAEADQGFLTAAAAVHEDRKTAGLSGLVGGLEAAVIAVEPGRFRDTAADVLRTTGLTWVESFADASGETGVFRLESEDAADILIRTRAEKGNPFAPFNDFPKSRHLPATRLETLVFRCSDIEAYHRIQKERGVLFMTDGPLRGDGFAFIQTRPSPLTGLSYGFIERASRERDYAFPKSRPLPIERPAARGAYLNHIGRLDHAATRLEARNRIPAILEFMAVTEYDFDFAVYVPGQNSITNVARVTKSDFALVFTSGIAPFSAPETSGPTEMFIRNYGPRVHHMAFCTEEIETTVESLRADGRDFMIDLIGSPELGLKQIFTRPFSNTLLVHEYIKRYGDFDGFFAESNVTRLTASTAGQ